MPVMLAEPCTGLGHKPRIRKSRQVSRPWLGGAAPRTMVCVPGSVGQATHGQSPAPEAPAHVAESEVWPFFLKQRDQILKDKWNSSHDAGYDIGMERAIREWLQRNYLVWAPEDVEDSESAEPAPPGPPA